jgi:HEPN domain-containing protein
MSDPEAIDPWPDVLEWLHVAESDVRAARLCLGADRPLHDVVAFHCQQAAEKLLKGFLVWAGVHVRKTHDLEVLGDLVRAHFPAVEPLLKPMADWNAWSVAYRYPGEAGGEPEPPADELSAALEVIAQLDAALRSLAPPASDAGIP